MCYAIQRSALTLLLNLILIFKTASASMHNLHLDLVDTHGEAIALFLPSIPNYYQNMNNLLPILILSTSYNFQNSPKFTKSAKTLGIFIKRHGSNKANKSALHQSGLMSSNLLEILLNPSTGNLELLSTRNPSNCFRISQNIFQYIPSGTDMDSYFHRIESIVLDFYSWFKDEIVATLNIKNRHIMILKVISTHLNLSFTSCDDTQYPKDRNERDIDFAISSYKLQRQKLPNAALIHSREKYKLTFASVKSRDFTAMFVALIRPVGWRIFACTAACILILTLCLKLYYKMCGDDVQLRKITIGRLILFLSRANIDQCSGQCELRRILQRKFDLQFVYAIWLFYCILIAATYRSKLVQQLLQPTSTLTASTFQELLEDDRKVVGLGGKRPGEYPDLRKIIRTEAEILATNNEQHRSNVLLQLLKVYKFDEGRKPDQILKGSINFLEDEVMLEVIFAIMKNRYGIHHYQIAKDVIVNHEFWAVKFGERTHRIVEVIGHLVNGGITDYFRSQQELMEHAASQIVLKAYFAAFFADGDHNPENDYQDDDVNDNEFDTLQKTMNWFTRMSSSLRKFETDLATGPVSLSTRHFQILWILLATGILVSIVSLMYECICL